MENKELKDIESDLYYDINELRNEFRSFKRRFSILTNIIVPGVGFFIFGKSYFKGVVAFISYLIYNYIVFKFIFPLGATQYDSIGGLLNFITIYFPAVIINLYSTIMVASLKD